MANKWRGNPSLVPLVLHLFRANSCQKHPENSAKQRELRPRRRGAAPATQEGLAVNRAANEGC